MKKTSVFCVCLLALSLAAQIGFAQKKPAPVTSGKPSPIKKSALSRLAKSIRGAWTILRIHKPDDASVTGALAFNDDGTAWQRVESNGRQLVVLYTYHLDGDIMTAAITRIVSGGAVVPSRAGKPQKFRLRIEGNHLHMISLQGKPQDLVYTRAKK